MGYPFGVCNLVHTHKNVRFVRCKSLQDMTQQKDTTQQQSTNTFSCNFVRKKTQETSIIM